MVSFNQRLIDRANEINSYLCVGIDISPELLGSDNIDDLIYHSKLVVDATREIALAYKPNFAFFERWGSKGFTWLDTGTHESLLEASNFVRNIEFKNEISVADLEVL